MLACSRKDDCLSSDSDMLSLDVSEMTAAAIRKLNNPKIQVELISFLSSPT